MKTKDLIPTTNQLTKAGIVTGSAVTVGMATNMVRNQWPQIEQMANQYLGATGSKIGVLALAGLVLAKNVNKKSELSLAFVGASISVLAQVIKSFMNETGSQLPAEDEGATEGALGNVASYFKKALMSPEAYPATGMGYARSRRRLSGAMRGAMRGVPSDAPRLMGVPSDAPQLMGVPADAHLMM